MSGGAGPAGNPGVMLNRMAAHMPAPGTKDAPHFDGLYPSDFIKRVDIMCKNAALTDDNEKVDYLYMYCSDRHLYGAAIYISQWYYL
ncbi:hypothetical protein VNI00_016193 [Paramarasmius palmivorus]|uniref:Uncharacterized protein n=1 Tax=Paramarasmius palmivorus TaxID=297713 RepID=A0AAW0BG12_9AGAR